jgi:hypothetical protein
MSGKPDDRAEQIFARVREILGAAQREAARTVNSTQVVANWLVG